MTIDLTQEELKELFNYDPETGLLTWKSRPSHHFHSQPIANRWNTIYVGKQAGMVKSHGYVGVTINNKSYIAHRIIWKLLYGEDCERPMDHINHVRSDNRLCNLRKVSYSENQRNKSIGCNNMTGCVGVSLTTSKIGGKAYYACIRIPGGKTVNLGYYYHLFDAVCARKSAEICLDYHENHGKISVEQQKTV